MTIGILVTMSRNLQWTTLVTSSIVSDFHAQSGTLPCLAMMPDLLSSLCAHPCALPRLVLPIKLDDNEFSDEAVTAPSGELLSLPWDPKLPSFAWARGRASMLKFEVSRRTSFPAEWTGFVPAASLVHSPGVVFERAVKLSGQVGTDPPTSACTVTSTGLGDGCAVSLEVAMVFLSSVSSGVGLLGEPISRFVSKGKRSLAAAVEKGQRVSNVTVPENVQSHPFHSDVRRIPCEAGELVVHCIRARNLRVPRRGKTGAADVNPELSITVVPDGCRETTSIHAGGGRHPVWGQVRWVDEGVRSQGGLNRVKQR